MESPNGTIRNILGGVIFREPIICKNVPRLVPGWTKPIVVGRHAFGDQYRATDFRFPGQGKLTIKIRRRGWQRPDRNEVFRPPLRASPWRCTTSTTSIIDFARASLNYGLMRGYPVYLSTKNTILKPMTAASRTCSRRSSTKSSPTVQRRHPYEHRLIDDMVASALKWSGGYVWACKNYDGDVQSDIVAQGFGSLGLMTSVPMTPDGKVGPRSEAAHGTVTRHYREHQKGRQTSTNSIASIFAWTGGLKHRAKLDDNAALMNFAETLERSP